MIDESLFRQAVSSTIKALGQQIDEIDTDDLDWKLTEGVLTVEFESGGVFVLSQQVPTRELWLSAFSTAWHFRCVDGAWPERDSGEAMDAVLGALFTRKLGMPVSLSL
jgi:iron donor protein CyaY